MGGTARVLTVLESALGCKSGFGSGIFHPWQGWENFCTYNERQLDESDARKLRRVKEREKE